LSGTGLALIFGWILSGWCLDRFWGPYMAITFFILPMVGIGILMSGAAGFAPFLGAIACGLGIGAEIDLMAFFTSRYFGLRDYAKTLWDHVWDFCARCRHWFDPVHVGVETGSPFAGAFAFDTRLPGNANSGHEYGTSLSEPERMALIEFLKTL